MSLADAAANEPTFLPPEWSDDDFVRWALHTALRLKNLMPGAPEYLMRRAIFHAGTPSPEWAQALIFMLTLAQASKRNAEPEMQAV